MDLTKYIDTDQFTTIVQHVGGVVGNFTQHYAELDPKKVMEDAAFEVKTDDLKELLETMGVTKKDVKAVNAELLDLFGFEAVEDNRMTPNGKMVVAMLLSEEYSQQQLVATLVDTNPEWGILLQGYYTFSERMYDMVFRSAEHSPRLEHLAFMRAQDQAGNYTPSMVGKPAITFIPWNQMDLGQWIDDCEADEYTTYVTGENDEGVYGVTFTYLPDLEA